MRITPRQLAYLSHAAKGESFKRIAHFEGVSFETVRTTLNTVRDRHGAKNVTHLVAMAVAEGLVKP
jgi:DNA-binding CsgD family transcriptional regulator